MTDRDAVEALVDAVCSEHGRLDLMFNNAGIAIVGPVADFSLDQWDRLVDVNIRGVIYGTHAAYRRMVAQGSGHIVNIASMAAYAPIPGIALYSASKFAVRAFSLAAAMELKDRGVAVTVVCPDAVATPMLDKQKDYEEAALTFTAPRILQPEEVAAELVGPVLERRPFEVALPRSRKWLARVMDTFPDLAPMVQPMFMKQGRARQSR